MSARKWIAFCGAAISILLLFLSLGGIPDDWRGWQKIVIFIQDYWKMNPVEVGQIVRTILIFIATAGLLIFCGVHKELLRLFKGDGELIIEWRPQDGRCNKLREEKMPDGRVDRIDRRALLVTNPPNNDRSIDELEVILLSLKSGDEYSLADVKLRLRDMPPYAPIRMNPGNVCELHAVTCCERPGLETFLTFGPYSREGLSWQIAQLPINERYEVTIRFAGVNLFPITKSFSFGYTATGFYFSYDD